MLNEVLSERMREHCDLRAELARKREKLTSTHWGILSLVIAILALGVSFYEQHFNFQNVPYEWLNELLSVMLVLVEIATFSVPVVVLYVVSVKISRDYQQVLMLSIYIQVFYEYPSSKNNMQAVEWEHIRQKLLMSVL